jgi:hypothetical protein
MVSLLEPIDDCCIAIDEPSFAASFNDGVVRAYEAM